MLRQQPPDTICHYVSQKNAGKVMEKVTKAKLSARAVEAVNLFLDQMLIQIVKHRNTAGKYGITHYQTVLDRIILDRELLKKCTDDAKSRSTQMITGLSLDFVMSAQDRVKTSDKVDTLKDDDPAYKARYLAHLRKFIVSCGLLCPKQQHSAFADRPGAHYFSLPVGLFIANAIEQLARFVLNRAALSVAKDKLSSVSADRIAYIFYHDQTIYSLASTTQFFQSLEVKTFKAVAVDDSNLPPLVTTGPLFVDSSLLFGSQISEEWDITATSVRSPTIQANETNSVSTSGEADATTAINRLSDHLSTNLSMSNDRSRDFEELFNSGRTVKLSLTPSRLRASSERPEIEKIQLNSAPTVRRRSLLSQTNSLFSR